MNRKRMRAFAIAACLLVALAFASVVALAAGDWWKGGDDSLTVKATSDATMQAELADADVVVDVYKIADAEARSTDQAFDYTLTSDFASLEIPADPSARDWENLALGASKLVDDNNLKPGSSGATAQKVDTKISLSDGLYLVRAHGADTTDALTAHSATHLYTFTPTVVALPSKAADADGVIRTDGSYGDWLADVTIALKPTPSPLYGSLRINKRVTDFSGEPATFVFHIKGTTPDGKTYENYASIYYTGGDSAYTTVTHIPAGTKLTVTESYTGARYELVSGDSSEKTITADIMVKDGKAEIASADFTNKSNGGGKGGHGIENNFELSAESGDNAWSPWTWKSVPEQTATEQQ